jgi:hypothetical protein
MEWKQEGGVSVGILFFPAAKDQDVERGRGVRWDSSQAFVEGCREGKGGFGLGLGLFVFWSEIDSEFSP